MDDHGFKRAVNRSLLRNAGWERRPVFFDIDHVRPPLRQLERACARRASEAFGTFPATL